MALTGVLEAALETRSGEGLALKIEVLIFSLNRFEGKTGRCECRETGFCSRSAARKLSIKRRL